VALTFKAAFRVVETIWPNPSGSGTVTASTTDTTIKFTVAMSNATGGHVAVAATGVECAVGSLDLSFNGDIAWILDVIKTLFGWLITDALQSEVQTEITSIFANTINPALAKIPTTLPLPLPAPFNVSAVQYGLTDAPTSNVAYLGLDLQGDFVSTVAGAPPAPFARPALPPYDPTFSGHYLTLLLSTYLFDTAAWVFYAAGLLSAVVPPTVIPPNSPVQLNVGALALVAPGILIQYPANTSVQLNVSVAAPIQATAAAATGAALTLPLQVAFQPITGPGASQPTAFVLACNATGAVDVAVNTTRPGKD
jgi:hypothetical protein